MRARTDGRRAKRHQLRAVAGRARHPCRASDRQSRSASRRRLDINVRLENTSKAPTSATRSTFSRTVQARPEVVECVGPSGETDYLMRLVWWPTWRTTRASS